MVSTRMKVVVALVIGLLIGAGLSYLAIVSLVPPTPSKPETIECKIGAVIPLTGALASIGKDFVNAIKMAEEDVNAMMEKTDSPWRFKVIFEDAKSTGADALAAVTTLVETQGVKTIIGLIMSTQIAACKSYLDTHKILALCAGTSPALAFEGDYIYRPQGTDALQAEALAHLAIYKGWKKVVGLVRDDAWGNALWDAFKQYFAELGGEVREIKFTPDLPDYASEVAALSLTVTNFGADAVLPLCFESEGTNILGHAIIDPVLREVGWISADNWKSEAYLAPNVPAEVDEFLIKVGFMGTTFLSAYNPRTEDFYKRYEAKFATKHVFPAALHMYDAVWLIALSTCVAGRYDSDAIIGVLPTVASSYAGVSGQKVMNKYGDVEIQNWAIWEFYKVSEGKYDFRNIAYYDGSIKEVIWRPPPEI